jgi:shikimate dehydrogenase
MTPPEITGATRILGLIADPVVQARSPALANDILRRSGRFGAFALLPMHVPAAALGAAVGGLRATLNFAGAIVSMPHKTTIVPLLDELTPESRLVGAVNVIAREADGRLRGNVLDGEGFVAGLRAAGHDIAGRSCLLVGAGGAASAIAVALATHGCGALTIANRTTAKAASLCARVRDACPRARVSVGDGSESAYDVVINATSLGMRPDDALPVAERVVERAGLVAECVIAPEMTALLRLAEARGRPIHTGVPMLAAQMDLILRFMGAA